MRFLSRSCRPGGLQSGKASRGTSSQPSTPVPFEPLESAQRLLRAADTTGRRVEGAAPVEPFPDPPSSRSIAAKNWLRSRSPRPDAAKSAEELEPSPAVSGRRSPANAKRDASDAIESNAGAASGERLAFARPAGIGRESPPRADRVAELAGPPAFPASCGVGRIASSDQSGARVAREPGSKREAGADSIVGPAGRPGGETAC